MTQDDMRIPVSVMMLLLIGVAGCETEAPGVRGAQVRDSAGVRIVENSAPGWDDGSGWKVSDVAILEIGTVEGDPAEQFSEIMGAARLEDGRWVVADGSTAELRLFDSHGLHEVTLTRRGGGPDELLGMMSFQRLPSDLLAVQETPGAPRFALIDVTSGSVRRTQLPGPAGGVPFAVAGWVDDTTVVVLESPRPSLRPGEQATPQVTFSRLGPDGTVARQIATVSGSTLYGREAGPPVGLTMGARLLPHVGADGLVLALPGGAELHRYQVDGTLTTVMRRETSSHRIDNPLIAQYLDALVASRARAGASPEVLSETRQRIEQTSIFAERVPIYSRVLADREGNVWVREWVVEHALPQTQAIPTFDDPDRWSVFDATGRWLGHVETPANFFVFEIGADYLVGLHRGELEIERIRVYALVKP